MTKEEYIRSVLTNIHSNRARAELREELENHITDRIDYYTDAGYDSESACTRAMDHMGDPIIVARNMDRLYSSKWNIAILVFTGLFYFLRLSSVFITILTMSNPMDNFMVIREIILIAATFVMLAIAQRKYWGWYCVFPIANIVMHFALLLYFYEGDIAGYILYFFDCLFTGGLDNYKYVVGSDMEIATSSFLGVQTVVAYVILLAVAVANMLLIFRSVRKGGTDRVHRFFVFTRVLGAVLSVVAIVCGFYAFYEENQNYSTADVYDSIVVYESDTKCDISTIPEENYLEFTTDYDFSPYPYIDCDGEDRHIVDSVDYSRDNVCRLDDFVSYRDDINRVIFKTDKKYVLILMRDTDNDGEEHIRSSDWQIADGYVFSDSLHYDGISLNEIEIQFVRGN